MEENAVEHWKIYHEDIPPVLRELCQTPAMIRLRKIGMNCGCEYTAFPRFFDLAPYSRFDHSLGVGLIVWHFTHDEKQAAAGLLHDISSPVFAHVVDFMNGDYLTQESTESDTRAVITASDELTAVLDRFGLTVDEVCDYHLYPIADNDTPQLSADRLEYTLGNAYNYGFATLSGIKALYDDLTVCENEQGVPELTFRSAQAALDFARLALRCSKVYVSDEDRFSMEALARVLRSAVSRGVLDRSELLTTEDAVIEKLLSDGNSAADWQQYRSYGVLLKSDCPQKGFFRVDAKKRHIDPLTVSGCRVSACFADFRAELDAFLAQPFDVWLSAKSGTDGAEKK